MSYQNILERYKYESDEELKLRIWQSDNEDKKEQRNIINDIVLWKLNRIVKVSDETLDLLVSLGDIKNPLDAITDKRVEELLVLLLDSKGIQLAIASTILHFYYPTIFPIIDQRAYRELTGEDLPQYTDKNKGRRNIKKYLDYIERCYKYRNANFPDADFSDIDKLLYQLDKEKGNKVKY